MLGVLVEKVSGKRLDVYLDEILFKPLKMKDTSFQATAEQLPRLADALDADPLKVALWNRRASRPIQASATGSAERLGLYGGGLFPLRPDDA